MKTVLVTATLLALLPLLPFAAADTGGVADAWCTPPVSQFGACLDRDCAVVDGPALRIVQCYGESEAIEPIPACDPPNTPVCTYKDSRGNTCYAVYYGKHLVVAECFSANAA